MDEQAVKAKWRPVLWVATTLGISRSHAYRLVAEGHFVAAQLGRNGSQRAIRVREDSVHAYLERQVLAMSLADPDADRE